MSCSSLQSCSLSGWTDQCNLSYSWYSLDKSDNDIITFLQYFIAGIQAKYKNLGVRAVKLLALNGKSSFESIATFLINDFLEIEENFHIVLDDYHLIENGEINKLLSFLLENLPANIQIVLITRSDPSMPLARLRSQQQVTDIRASDLCFNSNYIYDFFKKSLNIIFWNNSHIPFKTGVFCYNISSNTSMYLPNMHGRMWGFKSVILCSQR